jgi:hypothetical protein
MIMIGLISSGASTASVGCFAEFWTASSVETWPRVIDLSAYICAETCWKPIAGPPVRTSTLTPVSWPEATRGPRITFFLVSIV